MPEDRTRRMLDEAIAVALADHGTLPPPWRRYPGHDAWSSFWRMGGGEWYLMMFYRWGEGRSRDAWVQYLRAWAPLPVAWADWSACLLDPDDEGDDPERGVAALAALGLVDLDAWRRWWAAGGAAT